MICTKCGGEMEERCSSTNPPTTTWFCPMCGEFAEVGRIEIKREEPKGWGVGRLCSICGKKDGSAGYDQEWLCPDCVDVLREIVMERRDAHGSADPPAAQAVPSPMIEAARNEEVYL